MPETWSRTEQVTRAQTTEVDLSGHLQTTWSERWSGLARTVPLAVPVALVNGFAVYGQAGWAYENVDRHWLIAYLFAAALESIAVYLAWEAHSALMAGAAALKLRVTSYLMAALVGVLNYSHWAVDWRHPTAKALVFALFSVVSPWLWSIRSRSMRRADLRAQGLIDPRSVRFSAARWTLYPVRTFRAFRRAVWDGTVDPAQAIQAMSQTSRARLTQTTSQEVSVRVDVDSQTSTPGQVSDQQPDHLALDAQTTSQTSITAGLQTTSDQCRDQHARPPQTSLETSTPDHLRPVSRPARQTTKKSIAAARTATTQTRAEDRSIDQMVHAVKAAVQAGAIPPDLPIATTARELKVGKPKAREIIAVVQQSTKERSE